MSVFTWVNRMWKKNINWCQTWIEKNHLRVTLNFYWWLNTLKFTWKTVQWESRSSFIVYLNRYWKYKMKHFFSGIYLLGFYLLWIAEMVFGFWFDFQVINYVSIIAIPIIETKCLKQPHCLTVFDILLFVAGNTKTFTSIRSIFLKRLKWWMNTWSSFNSNEQILRHAQFNLFRMKCPCVFEISPRSNHQKN